jgi:flagellar protein FlaF
MAVGELIGAAIGVLLLIIVAYVLMGSTLSTAVIVSSAQKDMAQQQEVRLNTQIAVSPTVNSGNVSFTVTNTGSETINDVAHMDVFIYDQTGDVIWCTNSTGLATGTSDIWYFDGTPSYSLNPGGSFTGTSDVGSQIQAWTSPIRIKVVTANGVYNSTPLS